MDGYDGSGSGSGGMQPSTSGDQASVFFNNLQWWTTDAELESLCAEYGQVVGIRFIEDRSCGKSRGMAVVEFVEPYSVQPCIEGLNGRDINGRPCKVSRQFQRPPASMGPGMPGQHPGGRGMPGGRGSMMGGGGRGGAGGRGGRGMDQQHQQQQQQQYQQQMDPSMMSGGGGGFVNGMDPSMYGMGMMQGGMPQMMMGGPPMMGGGGGMMQGQGQGGYRPPPPPQ